MSLLIVSGVRRWALDHMLDIPNERSSHNAPTPLGGGISIALSTILLLLIALLLGEVSAASDTLALLFFIAGAVVIAALGWFDDRYTVSAKVRLLLQLGVGVLAVLIIGSVTQVRLPLSVVIVLAPLIAYFLNLIWVVGLLNIYNFMDGIDGLAGSQTVIAGIGWSALLLARGHRDLALFAALLAASSLGFLFLNRPRALIFMGDVGSTFIGFSLAMLPLLAFVRAPDSRLLGAGVLFVAPFVLDGAFTIIRRAVRRENVLQPHRSHIYQRLIKQGYSHLQVTGLYAVFALVSAACAWVYVAATSELLLTGAILIPLAIFAGMVIWTTRREEALARSSMTEAAAS